MPSLNKCFFIGNLTRDPEISYTPKGTAVAKLGIAVNRTWKDAQDQKQEEVTFLDLTAWAQTAEIIEKYLKKGSAAHFECRAKLDQWEDKTTGQKRSKINFVIEQLTFLPSGGKREAHEEESEEPPARGSRKPPAPDKPTGRRVPPRDPDLDTPEEDDIPF